MSKPKHTPGPWNVAEDWAKTQLRVDSYDGCVAIISNHDEGRQLDDKYPANARLIASAPDLLHAAEKLLARADEISEETEKYGSMIAKELVQLMEVVMKATGEK